MVYDVGVGVGAGERSCIKVEEKNPLLLNELQLIGRIFMYGLYGVIPYYN